MGFQSHLHGNPRWTSWCLDCALRRFMGDAAAYNCCNKKPSMTWPWRRRRITSGPALLIVRRAIDPESYSSRRCGERGPKKWGRLRVPRTMSSTTRNAGHALSSQRRKLLNQFGVFHQRPLHWKRGGADSVGETGYCLCRRRRRARLSLSVLFDAMPALSSGYNETPDRASRAFDADRDGFALRAAAAPWWSKNRPLRPGVRRFMPKSLDMARRRMVTTWYSRPVRAALAKSAMDTVDQPVDYINTHGTSTPVGDVKELTPSRKHSRTATGSLISTPPNP